MLWTLGTAIVLACSRAQLSAFETGPFDRQLFAGSLGTYYRVMAIVTAPFTGMAVAFLMVTGARLYRRQPLPLWEPGHWILLIFGVLFLLNVAVQFLSFLVQSEAIVRRDLTVVLVLTVVSQAAIVLPSAWLCWLAWRRIARPPRWRFVFGSSFVLCIFWIVAAVLTTGSMVLGDLSLFVMLPVAIVSIPIVIAWLISFPSAVIQDLWLRERYDALHWAGVVLVIVNVLAGISSMVFPLFVIRL